MKTLKLYLVAGMVLVLLAVAGAFGDNRETPPEPERPDTVIEASPMINVTPANFLAGEQIKWQVISSGGNRSSSSNYVLDATVAQTAVGAGNSANYGLSLGFWQDFGAGGCCILRVGNANALGTYPNEVTISDIQLLVMAKFISSLPCEQNLSCLTEADVNQSGGANPKCSDVTISDIQTLVNHLFIAGPANAPLKSCL